MSGRWIQKALGRHVRDEAGASLIEYTVVVSLFLLVFFAVLDFGRLGFNWVMTEKAMQRAARIATVRPPVCANVPTTYGLGSNTAARFGTLCRAGANMCANGGVQSCVLGTAAFDCTNVTTTAGEIWCTLEQILPSNAVPQNIWVRYAFDPQLGFAGGPYAPMVTVGVTTADNVAALGGNTVVASAQELRFSFITPIPGFMALVGGGAPTTIDTSGTRTALPSIPFPDISVTLPGEDLDHGNNG